MVHPDAFARKLKRLLDLDEEDADALLRIPAQVADIAADQDIVREGEPSSRSFALLEGVACSYKVTGDGRRQILAWHFVGDMPDLHSLLLPSPDVSVSAIVACKIAFLDHEALRQICTERPRVASALWRETLVVASIARAWLLNVGQRDAVRRAAHLICETVRRMQAIGLAEGMTIDLPVTQDELADALGISAVHTNRVLQELKSRGLAVWTRRQLVILDFEALARFGDFDATYLHLPDR